MAEEIPDFAITQAVRLRPECPLTLALVWGRRRSAMLGAG